MKQVAAQERRRTSLLADVVNPELADHALGAVANSMHEETARTVLVDGAKVLMPRAGRDKKIFFSE